MVQSRREFFSGPLYGLTTSPTTSSSSANIDLAWPFGKLETIDHDDIRETAYEIFFTSCRSSPEFGGRNALMFYSSHENQHNHHGDEGSSGGLSSQGPGSPSRRANHGAVNAPSSRVKRALGLKMVKRPQHTRRMSMSSLNFSSDGGGGSSSPSSPGSSPGVGSAFSTLPGRPRRPLTSAELMRQQMRVTEQSDNRLRKTLMRTLVGLTGKKSDNIILPLELIRFIKPSEFNDPHEYHIWQKRQLKILEAGLLLYPSVPIEKSNSLVTCLREIIRSSDFKPIDISKNSDTMRTLSNTAISLAWRSTNGSPNNVPHWADGFPFNIHLYTCLLQAIFDIRDETQVLDEVDELLELMKKTWTTLGINRPIHNACFTWVLFQQYVSTNQTEPDLLYAAYTMLTEVENDAKKPDREASYVKLLSLMLDSIQNWAEKRLLSYHDYFNKGTISGIESLLPLALSSAKILGEDVKIMEGEGGENGDIMLVDSTSDRVDLYIRSSVKNAFAKMVENENAKLANTEEKEEPSVTILKFAKKTEVLAEKEKELFSPILKRWHPVATGVAVVTLHQCYGALLKQHLSGTRMLNSEIVGVLQGASKLEKVLVQMVVEDSVECEDGGKGIIREMSPYEVDSIILKLLRQWIDERLKKGKDLLSRAKETENWNPKSKSEPYAQSAEELLNLAKEMVKDFFEIPIGITNDLILDLAEGLEQLFQEYTTFVASCGSKKSYLPTLPPLTRCNRDSKFFKIWKKASPCSVGVEHMHRIVNMDGHHSRPSTSRGTQRLYIRLNALHYLITNLPSLDKALATSPKVSTQNNSSGRSGRGASYSFFENVNASIQSACDHVSEVAAYRLIFLDSNSVFYENLYVGDVANSRIRPAVKILKQNLTLLNAIVIDRVQAVAMKEVMKASFEAFLMVLLAGGPSRTFNRSDHEMINDDFDSLKRVFCNCGEGLISDDIVKKEADTIEGVISLMSLSTEQLTEDLSIITCETSGIGLVGTGQKLPMPPTTGRWDRSDPNTILRVLCHRNDRVANQFLKKSFQLAKRK
ncbi:hypothetical protein ES332_D02G062600v1 [Gossypium tomentosum]|uniref:MHD1 domain-containing protein n=1 Tax=Gossypium tomentosum TaxID=34277 RepID=A0A5D2LTS4_GOSTO|nr:hypothetical protein ES332_D02G062600v1 [Gossypium tomentosum]